MKKIVAAKKSNGNGQALATIKATFDKDSKRYHRFIIDEGQGIVGNLYVPKGEMGKYGTLTVSLQAGGADAN